MKRSKKLLSMLLAATMVCGLNTVPAAAAVANQAGQYGSGVASDPLTTLPFTKILRIPEEAILPADEFSFEMVPVSSESIAEGEQLNNMDVYPGVDLKESEVNLLMGSRTDTTAAGTLTYDELTNARKAVRSEDQITIDLSFDLSDIDFSEHGQGIYRYEVFETYDAIQSETGDDGATTRVDHIVYDERVYTVDLYVDKSTVTNADTGETEDKFVILYAQAMDEDGTKAPIEFENICDTSTILISKTVEGTFTDTTKDFSFAVKIPVGGDELNLVEGTEMNAYKLTAGNQREDVSILVDGEKDDDEGWNYFTLKAGEKLYIENVPVGMIYFVKEVNNEDGNYDGYIPKYYHVVNKDSVPTNASYTKGTETGWLTTGATSDGMYNIVAFKNVRDDINTGIVLDIMPYAVVVLAAAACAVLFFFKKRRVVR
jgi:hypothetical protein